MVKKHEAIIVGGGVIGCSIAFYLAKEGRNVLLVEKEQIGQQSSAAAAGMLGVQAELTEETPLYHLAKASVQLFPSLAEELKERTGIDIGYRQTGALKPAWSEEDWTMLANTQAWQASQGEQAELLTRSEVLDLEPALSDSLLGGLYFPNEAQVTATELVRALAVGARSYGARIEPYQEVLEVIKEANQARGIRTARGTYYADHVVIASGVWSNKRSLIHSDIDLYPIQGEALSVKVAKPLLSTTIFSRDCYLTPKTADTIFIGATEKPYQYDTTPTVDGVYQLLRAARSLLPSLGEANIGQIWAGLRPTTPNHLPYIGQAPSIDNLWYAFGHRRNGILLSAITGRLISELIHERTVPFDLTAFSHEEVKQ